MSAPRQEIGLRIRQILADALLLEIDPAAIRDDDVIFEEDLRADSIAALEILTSIEDEFGILFDDDEIRHEMFFSVRSLSMAVEEKMRAVLGNGSSADS